jgi:hypothetical protein
MQTPDDRGPREHARRSASNYVGVIPRAPLVPWSYLLGDIPHRFGSLFDSVKGCGLHANGPLVHGQYPPYRYDLALQRGIKKIAFTHADHDVICAFDLARSHEREVENLNRGKAALSAGHINPRLSLKANQPARLGNRD